jgi:hypothetical protein
VHAHYLLSDLFWSTIRIWHLKIFHNFCENFRRNFRAKLSLFS